MRAIELHEHMTSIGTWVDWNHTCDRFIMGDPIAEVRGIAVGWQARTAALRRAVSIGCNLFVTHEPVFYGHTDSDESVFSAPHAIAKRRFIEENGLVIYRCHDVWDRMPEVGIVDSWANHLGLTDRVASDSYHSVYQSPARSLRELAAYVAARTRNLGQDSVEMVGDPDARMSTVAIGCGAITHYETMVGLGADAIIGTDDGMSYWGGGEWALDGEVPLVIVNHATAEEPGILNLAGYIRKVFAGADVEHIAQGCVYRTLV